MPEQDAYASRSSVPGYASRRRAFLDYHAARPGNGVHSELVRLALGQRPDEALIERDLDRIDARRDCADFGLSGVLRLLYQYGDSPLLSQEILEHARRSVLGFKYWPDEPGIDSMCTWSENHHILFASGAYLAGQLYPDERFANSGDSGATVMSRARPRVVRWLDLRYRTGFSEWLSNVYYVEDLVALLNLVDFCRDDAIATRAAMVLDLMVLDMAVNHYRGTFGSTHGRSYHRHKVDGAREGTAPIYKLLFGLNAFRVGNMAAVAFALSGNYALPAVLYEIANDLDRPEMENWQRMGIRIEEAGRWDLDPRCLEDGMTFLSLEAYAHPRTIDTTMRMLDAYNWWENDFFAPFGRRKGLIGTARRLGLLPLVARAFERDLTRNTRTEVNIYTYRTPDYLLSSAQDYRPGYGGDQQHIWGATLGQRAICFTTHPACLEGRSPNYWTGSGSLPRVAQVKNVALVLYDISTRPGLYVTHELLYTHAWLPRVAFDEVLEREGWILARKGEGYLALWSARPYHWQTEGEWADVEVIAPGKRNVWVCELGRGAVDGGFAEFADCIVEAPLQVSLRASALRVSYRSPSQGQLEFAWRGDLRRNGERLRLGEYGRYENPYASVPFPARTVEVRHNGERLRLDWEGLRRKASGFVTER